MVAETRQGGLYLITGTKRRIRQGFWSNVFDVFNYIFLALVGVVTLGPFLYLIFGSLTESDFYLTRGVTANPFHWSLASYRILLGGGSRIYQALRVTTFITVVGTFLSLLVTAAGAYGLSRTELPGRRLLTFLVFFTMMFSGGMVPLYLVVRGVGLTETVWSLIIPFLVGAWYMLVMIKFFETLPRELEDAALIDGASQLGIFFRIVLPLSKPVLATIGLFYAVGYWNQWFWASIFTRDQQIATLQLVLNRTLAEFWPLLNPEAMLERARQVPVPPPVVLRMASIVVAVLPIAAVYPFLQGYFVKGLMVGSIKG